VRNLISLSAPSYNSSSNAGPPVSEPSNELTDALKNVGWLEDGITIKDEEVYRVFEANGRVRTVTPSNGKGYVPVNMSWHISGSTLYVQGFDPDTQKLVIECNGILKGNRIEGEYKNLITGSISKWLLTRIE
jgi:hypothetical protein